MKYLLVNLNEQFYNDVNNSIHLIIVEYIFLFFVQWLLTVNQDNQINVHRISYQQKNKSFGIKFLLLSYNSEIIIENEFVSINWNTLIIASWRIDETRAYSCKARSCEIDFFDINLTAHTSPDDIWIHWRITEWRPLS